MGAWSDIRAKAHDFKQSVLDKTTIDEKFSAKVDAFKQTHIGEMLSGVTSHISVGLKAAYAKAGEFARGFSDKIRSITHDNEKDSEPSSTAAVKSERGYELEDIRSASDDNDCEYDG